MNVKLFGATEAAKKAEPFRKPNEIIGETLYIRAVSEDTSATYDQTQFIFHATLLTGSQEESIRFSLNDAGPQRRRLYEHFLSHPDAVYGPCSLQLVEMANGRSFYKFIDIES